MKNHFGIRWKKQPIGYIASFGFHCELQIMVSLLFALLLTGCSGDRTKIDETTKRGDVIIRALEQFRADSGNYPKSLSELQPKYITKLPQPVWGLETWQYEADESEFTLRVNESSDTGDGIHLWLRNRNNSGWKMGD
jgi:hypothetical protein